MNENVAILVVNDNESENAFVQYMKDNENSCKYRIYEFKSNTIEGMVDEILDNCQDVILAYDAEVGISPRFDGFIRELHRYEIEPIIVVLVHDGYFVTREEAEEIIPDIICLEDPEYDVSLYIPRVVFFNQEYGFGTEPDFDMIVDINFIIM